MRKDKQKVIGEEISDDSINLKELRKSLQESAREMNASLAFENGKKDISIILAIPVKSYSFLPYGIFGHKK